jgi:hypothetical protein
MKKQIRTFQTDPAVEKKLDQEKKKNIYLSISEIIRKLITGEL